MLNDYAIPPLAEPLRERVSAALDAKTKPPGSLGRLESLALTLALAQDDEHPRADPARLLLFAGDHGITQEGVSAWPQEVTAQMVANFLSGGAAANVLARSVGAEVTVVDAGVAADLPPHPDLKTLAVAKGTRNAALEDAMTEAECAEALRRGAALAAEATANGARIILLGEMGIGNTSSATLIGSALTGLPVAYLVGPGAGLTADGVDRKCAVLEKARARHPGTLSAEAALAAFGGFEVAMMTGAAIASAAARVPVLVDGFIATAAALAAVKARPEIAGYLVYAHRSAEPGHAGLLEALSADPLLDLGMRLGEGSAALAALPLLRAACDILRDMATFESAGVSDKAG